MAEQQTFGDFGFQSDPITPSPLDMPSVRELVESIAVAIILAVIFKTIQAEAYIIPTGSMAPNLMGQHMDLQCEECGYWFRSGNDKNEAPGLMPNTLTAEVTCPACHKVQQINRKQLKAKFIQTFEKNEYDPNRDSFVGDRIVVNKLHYIFNNPKRWDVIVFKYPGNAKQNYIKRLVGLPDETVLMNNGDIYTTPTESLEGAPENLTREKTIARKSPEKIMAMAIPVADSHYFSKTLRKADWPSDWFVQKKPTESSNWSKYQSSNNLWIESSERDQATTFRIDDPQTSESSEYQWLRFQNLIPNRTVWESAMAGESVRALVPKPSAISDFYAYNSTLPIGINYDDKQPNQRAHVEGFRERLYNPYGYFWVGDLVVETEFQLDSNDGKLAVDLVEGGVHFLCQLDLKNSKGTIQPVTSLANVTCRFQSAGGQYDQEKIEFPIPSLSTGNHSIRYANFDDKIVLWIDGTAVELPGNGHYSRKGPCSLTYSGSDAGDLLPAGFGSQGNKIVASRFKVFRDLYYFHPKNKHNEKLQAFGSFQSSKNLWNSPNHWSMASDISQMKEGNTKYKLDWSMAFQLRDGQYFPLGDNSPVSLDGRLWEAPKYVDKKQMIGKAFVVYWPHTWNNPPYIPNFSRMRWIR